MAKNGSVRSSRCSDVEVTAIYFDPNDPRYRCCCQQCHSTVGVKIIAGLLCVTVLLELWHLVLYLASNEAQDSTTLASSLFQLSVGVGISASVLYALHCENAAFLSPYLLLQTVGLAAGFVIFFALTYITATNDLTTIKTFLESHGPPVEDDKYLIYVGWTMVGSCVAVLAIQFWLISVVFSCWRYFRDKRQFGYCKDHTSSLVVLRPLSNHSDVDHSQDCDGYNPLHETV